jgi:general secretion pathway protein G
MRRQRLTKGFTLVEMMVVIVIIGILAGVLITQLSNRADRAKVEATKAMITQISQQLDLFKLDHNRYPESGRLEDLMVMPGYANPKTWPQGGYFKKAPRDGWDREFIYRVPGVKDQPYDVVSLGEDGRDGGQGTMEDLWNHDAYKR